MPPEEMRRHYATHLTEEAALKGVDSRDGGRLLISSPESVIYKLHDPVKTP